eukprot:gene11816-44_t
MQRLAPPGPRRAKGRGRSTLGVHRGAARRAPRRSEGGGSHNGRMKLPPGIRDVVRNLSPPCCSRLPLPGGPVWKPDEPPPLDATVDASSCTGTAEGAECASWACADPTWIKGAGTVSCEAATGEPTSPGPAGAPPCFNGLKDAGEDDVDCGGTSTCDPCYVCEAAFCAPATATAAEQTAVLNYINGKRSELYGGTTPGFPTPDYMANMVWDDEMARTASWHSNLCDYVMSAPNQVPATPPTAQVLYMTTVNDAPVELALGKFWEKASSYNYASGVCSDGAGQCDGFRNMVSSSTTRVGCSVSHNCNYVQGGNTYQSLIVCYFTRPAEDPLYPQYAATPSWTSTATCTAPPPPPVAPPPAACTDPAAIANGNTAPCDPTASGSTCTLWTCLPGCVDWPAAPWLAVVGPACPDSVRLPAARHLSLSSWLVPAVPPRRPHRLVVLQAFVAAVSVGKASAFCLRPLPPSAARHVTSPLSGPVRDSAGGRAGPGTEWAGCPASFHPLPCAAFSWTTVFCPWALLLFPSSVHLRYNPVGQLDCIQPAGVAPTGPGPAGAPPCFNGIRDAGEDDVDCGGTSSCGSCFTCHEPHCATPTLSAADQTASLNFVNGKRATLFTAPPGSSRLRCPLPAARPAGRTSLPQPGLCGCLAHPGRVRPASTPPVPAGYPTPAYLANAVWDDEMARTAAYHATLCDGTGGLPQASLPATPPVSSVQPPRRPWLTVQVTWMTTSPTADMSGALDKCPPALPVCQSVMWPPPDDRAIAVLRRWWANVADYDYATDACMSNNCEGFKAIASATTTRMGCAVNNGCSLTNGGFTYRSFVACYFTRPPQNPLYPEYSNNPTWGPSPTCEVADPPPISNNPCGQPGDILSGTGESNCAGTLPGETCPMALGGWQCDPDFTPEGTLECLPAGLPPTGTGPAGAPACFNGIQDALETGVDCGGGGCDDCYACNPPNCAGPSASQTDANMVVSNINSKRGGLITNPPAGWPVPDYMPNIVWDNEMAKTATWHSQRCDGALTPNGMLPTTPPVAQTIFFSTSATAGLDTGLDRWWQKLGDYTMPADTCSSSDCEGFQQMAGSSTTRVGCAVNNNCALTQGDFTYRSYVVCYWTRPYSAPLYQAYENTPQWGPLPVCVPNPPPPPPADCTVPPTIADSSGVTTCNPTPADTTCTSWQCDPGFVQVGSLDCVGSSGSAPQSLGMNAPPCFNGVRDGSETDVDCGGNCDSCYVCAEPNCAPHSGNLDQDADVLAFINGKRQEILVSPPAGWPQPAYLPRLVWDDEMARTAQFHANKCDGTLLSPNEYPATPPTAQTIYMTTDNNAEMTLAMTKWWAKLADFNYPDGGTACANGECDGFKQMISAATTRVGCSETHDCNHAAQGNTYQTFIVCHWTRPAPSPVYPAFSSDPAWGPAPTCESIPSPPAALCSQPGDILNGSGEPSCAGTAGGDTCPMGSSGWLAPLTALPPPAPPLRALALLAPPPCFNGIQDAGESGVDCGGNGCDPCYVCKQPYCAPGGATPAEQSAVLNYVNGKRASLATAPPAGWDTPDYMAGMVWDTELARTAAWHSSLCDGSLTAPDKLPTSPPVAQTIYFTTSGGATIDTALGKWWDKISCYDPASGQCNQACLGTGNCQGFLQMAGSVTTRVGCAVNNGCSLAQGGYTYRSYINCPIPGDIAFGSQEITCDGTPGGQTCVSWSCDPGYTQEGTLDCIAPLGAAPTTTGPAGAPQCFNGILDGGETSVDCGGGGCDPCFVCKADNCLPTSMPGPDQSRVVAFINTKRGQLLTNPPAGWSQPAYMANMVWDDELARVASWHAKKCDGMLSPSSSLPNAPPVAQTIYMTTAADSDVEVGLGKWWDKISQYDPASGRCTATGQDACDGFTQMAGSVTTRVGCAVDHDCSLESGPYTYRSYIVCYWTRPHEGPLYEPFVNVPQWGPLPICVPPPPALPCAMPGTVDNSAGVPSCDGTMGGVRCTSWTCNPGYDQVGTLDCIDPPEDTPQGTGSEGAPPCYNGIRDNGESGVDCGGSSGCDPCYLCNEPHCAQPTADSTHRNTVLTFINGKRSSLFTSPPPGWQQPAYMANMVWDEELAKTAQWHSSRCDGQLTAQNDLPLEPPIAQTIYMTTSDNAEIEYALEKWWDKISCYSPATQSCDQACVGGGNCQGFTQMAGSVTTRVGCAVNHACSLEQGAYTYKSYIVCYWTRPYEKELFQPPPQGPYWGPLPMCVERVPPPPVPCATPDDIINGSKEPTCNGTPGGSTCVSWECDPGFDQIGTLDCIAIDNSAQTTVITTINAKRALLFSSPPTGWPTPSFLAQMVWDDELAQTAEAHATKCDGMLSSSNFVPAQPPVAQTIYMTTAADSKIDVALDRWWSKIDSYDFAQQKCSDPNCQGFLQMAGSITTRVGCAVNHGCNLQSGDYLYKSYIVCYWTRPHDGPLYQEFDPEPRWGPLPLCVAPPVAVPCDHPGEVVHGSRTETCVGTMPGMTCVSWGCDPGFKQEGTLDCLPPMHETPNQTGPTNAPPCFNGQQDNGETGIDCGGPCDPCYVCEPPNCGSGTELDVDDRQTVLDFINGKRTSLFNQPPAGWDKPAYLATMVWDSELAKTAEAHADQCDGTLTNAAFVPTDPPVAQTILFSTDSSADIANALDKWWAKIQHFDYNSQQCLPSAGNAGCQGFMQMAGHVTTRVGCAVNQGCSLQSGDYVYKSYVVCYWTRPFQTRLYAPLMEGPTWGPLPECVEEAVPMFCDAPGHIEHSTGVPDCEGRPVGTTCVSDADRPPSGTWRCDPGFIQNGTLDCLAGYGGAEKVGAFGAPPCYNGVQDAGEAGVDCGGNGCDPCYTCKDPYCAPQTLPAGDANAVINFVNDKRQSLFDSPLSGWQTPAYMANMVWDDELAKTASWHSSLCDGQLSALDKVPESPPIAQTIFFSTDEAIGINAALDRWWAKMNCYDWATGQCDAACLSGGNCQGFLQMAGSVTTRVGCAVNNGCDFTSGPYVYKSYVVCYWTRPYSKPLYEVVHKGPHWGPLPTCGPPVPKCPAPGVIENSYGVPGCEGYEPPYQCKSRGSNVTGTAGETWGCNPGYTQVGELDCLEGHPAPVSTGPAGAPQCFNGVQDNGETSVDCGNADCDACVVCKEPNCANPSALDSEQATVLSFINGKRQGIVSGDISGLPRPAFMADMVWDDELAKIASWHASGCSLTLSLPDDLPDSPPVAQTLFFATSPDATINTALTRWWDKLDTFNFATGKCSGECDGFLQMAGSTTTRVGCAVNNGCSVQQGEFNYKSSVVCYWTRPYNVVNGLYPSYSGGDPYWDTLPTCQPPPPVAPPVCSAPDLWANVDPSSILPWEGHACEGIRPGNECTSWKCAPGYEPNNKLICRQRGQDPDADPTNPVPTCFNNQLDAGEDRIDCGGNCDLDCIICDNGNCHTNGVPASAQTNILQDINNRRMSFFLTPPPGAQKAAFMPSVMWDDEYAKFAQYHVDKCDMQLTTDDEAPGPMGQTIFFSTKDTTPITKAIEIWWNKINDFDFQSGECTAANGDCHGFQQMAWTKTVKVGCAINKGCSVQQGEFNYKTFIACHWGPPYDGTQPLIDDVVVDEEWILPQCLPVTCDAPSGFAHVKPQTLPPCAGTAIDDECTKFECEEGYEPTKKMICLGPEEALEDGQHRTFDPPACYNGLQDGDEAGVDCGGSCIFECVDCDDDSGNCMPNGISVTGQNAALSFINSNRQKMMTSPPPGLDPPPAYMPNMVWDPEIAQFAQWHVQRCDMRMASPLDAPAPLGQTVFFSTKPTLTLQDALDKWWDMIDCYDFTTGTCDTTCAPAGCDGFLQMAWSKTTKVGCAVNQNCNYPGKSNDKDVVYQSYVACHWGPPYDPKDALVVQEFSAEWTDPGCLPKREYCTDPPALIENADNDSTHKCVPTEFGVPCTEWSCNRGYLPVGDLNPNCADPLDDGVDIVRHLNEKRASFFTDPPQGHKPAYMPNVVWDKEMAKFAQWHVNTCSMQTVQQGFMPGALGNTVFFNTKNDVDIENVMDKWWGKLDCYDFASKTCKTNSAECQGSCDGFLQMAWSKTTKVGCAYNHACTFPGMSQGKQVIFKTMVSCMWGPPFDNSELFPPAPPPDIWRYPICQPLLCEDPPDAVENSNSPLATAPCAGQWAGSTCEPFQCFPSYTQVGAMICRGRPAMAGEEMPPPCMNGHQDAAESAIDCGGDVCAPCASCGPEPNQCSPNPMKGEAGQTERTTILNALNSKRQALILGTDAAKPKSMPSPAYMANIVWDDTMAEYAQWLADQCRPLSDSFLTREEMNGMDLGHSVFLGAASSWDSVVNIWWSQISCYDYETNTCADTPECNAGCDNFKQLASSATTRMGCASNNNCRDKNNYPTTMACLFGLPFNHNAPPFPAPSQSEWQLPQCRDPAYIYHYGFDSAVSPPPPPIMPPNLVTSSSLQNMSITQLLYTYQHSNNQQIRNQILTTSVVNNAGQSVNTGNVIKNYQSYTSSFRQNSNNANVPAPTIANNAAAYGYSDSSIIITKTGAHTVKEIREDSHAAGYGFGALAPAPQVATSYKSYGYNANDMIYVGGDIGYANISYIQTHLNKFDGQNYQKEHVDIQNGQNLPPVRVAKQPIPVPPPPPPIHLFRPTAAPAPAFLAYGTDVSENYKSVVGANIQTTNYGSVTQPWAIAHADKIMVQTTTQGEVTLKQAQEQNLELTYKATNPPPPPFSQDIVKIAQNAPLYGYGANSQVQTANGVVTIKQVLENPQAYVGQQITYVQKQENRVYKGDATLAPAPIIALNPPVYNIRVGEAIPLKAVNGEPRAAVPAPILVTNKYEYGYGIGGRPVPTPIGNVPIPNILQNVEKYERTVITGVNKNTGKPFASPAPQVASHVYTYGYEKSTMPAPIPTSSGNIPYPKLTDVTTAKNYESVIVTGTKQTSEGPVPFSAPAPKVAANAVVYGYQAGGTKVIPTASGKSVDVSTVIQNIQNYRNEVVDGVRTVENQPFAQPVPVVMNNYQNYAYWKQSNVQVTDQSGNTKTVSLPTIQANSANYESSTIINRQGVTMQVPFRAPAPQVATNPTFGYASSSSKSYEFKEVIKNTGFQGSDLGSTSVKSAPVPLIAQNLPAYGYAGAGQIVLPGKGVVDISTIRKNYANYQYGLTGVSPSGTPFRAPVPAIASNSASYGYGVSGSITTANGQLSIKDVLANTANYEYTTSVTNLQGQTVEVPVPTVATNAPNYGYGTAAALTTPSGRVPVPAVNNDLAKYDYNMDVATDGKYSTVTGSGGSDGVAGLSGAAGQASAGCKEGNAKDCKYLAEQVGAASAFGSEAGFDTAAQLEMAEGGAVAGAQLQIGLADALTGEQCSGVAAAICDPNQWGSRTTGVVCSGVTDPSAPGAVTCGIVCDFECDQGLEGMGLVDPQGGTRGKCFPDGNMYFWRPSQATDGGAAGGSWTGEFTTAKPECKYTDKYGFDDCYMGKTCTEFQSYMGAGTSQTSSLDEEGKEVFRGGSEGVTIQAWDDNADLKDANGQVQEAAYQFGAKGYVDKDVVSNPDTCNQNKTCKPPPGLDGSLIVENANVTCVSASACGDSAGCDSASDEDKAKAVCNEICTWVCAPGLVHSGPNKVKCMPDGKLHLY